MQHLPVFGIIFIIVSVSLINSFFYSKDMGTLHCNKSVMQSALYMYVFVLIPAKCLCNEIAIAFTSTKNALISGFTLILYLEMKLTGVEGLLFEWKQRNINLNMKILFLCLFPIRQ